MKLYVVEFDNGMDNYKLLGIYDSKERAEKRQKDFPKAHKDYILITEVNLNTPIG